MNKLYHSCLEAVSDIKDGSTILVGGFGEAGTPTELLHALIQHNPKYLTIVSNNAGNGILGLAQLLKRGCVSKIICSYPRSSHSDIFIEEYLAGRVTLEVVPQGTLAERIRAGGAGIGGFYCKAGVGTVLENDREIREINNEKFIFELPIKADVALVKADRADQWGNLTYRKAARNFGPIMCTAAKMTIVQVREFTYNQPLEPEAVITPAIFTNRIIEIPNPLIESQYLSKPDEAQKILETLL